MGPCTPAPIREGHSRAQNSYQQRALSKPQQLNQNDMTTEVSGLCPVPRRGRNVCEWYWHVNVLRVALQLYILNFKKIA